MAELNEVIPKFFVEDNKVHVYKYLCTYVNNTDANNPQELQVYLAENGTSNILNNTVETFKSDFVDKHSLLTIKNTEAIDISDIEWMDGIPVDAAYKSTPTKYIEYLLSIGKEAYEQSLVSTPEDYMTDLDYRLSLIEMGLN